METFLTEQTLPDLLTVVFPETSDWSHNKKFLQYNFRPDFVSESLKLVVEFDGYHHYTDSRVVINDIIKDKIIRKNRYKIIRIPYFVQPCTELIECFFQKRVDYPQQYPHGFISDNCILPADFCELGQERFLKDLTRLTSPIKWEESISKKIIDSLFEKEIKLPPYYDETFGENLLPLSRLILNSSIFDFDVEKVSQELWEEADPDESSFEFYEDGNLNDFIPDGKTPEEFPMERLTFIAKTCLKTLKEIFEQRKIMREKWMNGDLSYFQWLDEYKNLMDSRRIYEDLIINDNDSWKK